MNRKLSELVEKQEAEKKDLAAGVYTAWQSVKETEEMWLLPYEGQKEHAPQEVNDKISKNREAFFVEWGSDGKLAVLMNERHALEREKLAKDLDRKEHIISDLETSRHRQREKQRGR